MVSDTAESFQDIPNNEPTCVGFVMDGNRRWAKEQGKPGYRGHHAGYKKFKEVTDWCKERNLHNLVIYAFSTENWRRSEKEVGYLMDLMRTLIDEWLPKLHKEKTAVHVVGDIPLFPHDLQGAIQNLHEKNPVDPEYNLWVAASYGGRSEILHAVNNLLEKGVGKVTEDEFENELWTSALPDPDLIIRTGGKQRLSNFLLWKAAYSELWFTDTLWPNFSKDEFIKAFEEYAVRKRNFGK